MDDPFYEIVQFFKKNIYYKTFVVGLHEAQTSP